MADEIRRAHAIDVTMTPTKRPGEFSVWVGGIRVINKLLPFVRPSDEKVLAAVGRALR